RWCIWIRWQSRDGVEGAVVGGLHGVQATTGKIGNSQLGALAVEAANLAAGSVTTVKFEAGTEPVTIVSTGPLPTVKSTNAILYGGKLYRWTGSAYSAAVATADLSGTVSNGQIANGAVTTSKLATGAVTANEIAANTITTNELAANAVTVGKIAAGAVTTDKLQANAVTANELAANAVTAGKLAANAIAVGTAAIQNGAIVNAMIGNLAVDNAKIANVSVAKLTAGTLAVGAYIQSTNYVAGVSGWIDRADGYSERNNVVVRGTVYATAGEYSAVVRMGAASSYGAGVGLWQGYDGENYVWRVGDPEGNRAQWDGAQFSVYIAGQAQPIIAAGGISAGTGTLVINTPGLTLNPAGDAVFGGTLAAAVGTFAGTLSAGTVTPSAFEAIVEQFISAGTFNLTVPAKREGWFGLACRVTLQAAGGGGGGAYGTGAPNSNPIASGGGGAAGQRYIAVFESVTPGQVLNLVVGAGGAGGGASQVNANGAAAGNGANGGNSSVTFAGVTSTATGGAGGRGGWRDNALIAGGYVVPGGSSAAGNGYARTRDTGLYFDGENYYYTTNGANGGYGASSAYGSGGAAGTFWYRGASNGGSGGTGAGGGGGGADCQHPDVAYTGNGGPGGNGYILVEFYDPYSVVTNKRYSKLIEWLDTRGLGAVPSNAR
ncbi:MAG TPA: hypothetical protein VMS38_20400, partial [Pseudorhodoferax sp.]|nr:hypothetical protein [Pseudorhodoferax sp.]